VNLHPFSSLLLACVHREFHQGRTDTLEFSRASACYPSGVRSCEPENQTVVVPQRVASEAACLRRPSQDGFTAGEEDRSETAAA
jgi:hypothetical protein